MPFGKQRQRGHKRKEEITTSLSHMRAAIEKEKRKYMQDISRCHSDEVMQVDNNCIPPSNLLGVVASPPCTTFSNYDGNRQIHRDHQRPGKPAKSSLAREHDALVANLFHYLFPRPCTWIIASSNFDMGNKSDNRDISLAKIWVGAIFWLGSWEGCTRR